jgi:hypothetical protein
MEYFWRTEHLFPIVLRLNNKLVQLYVLLSSLLTFQAMLTQEIELMCCMLADEIMAQ